MKIPNIKIKPPGPKAKAIVEKDQRYTAPAYGRVYPLVVKEGRGMVIEDVDGNLFLDFMAGIAVASTGHSHPKVVKAIEEQARKFLHICGSDFYYEPMAELVEKLSQLAPGSSPKKVFLTNSGTETIEAAFKLARFATKRNHIVSFPGIFSRSHHGIALSDGEPFLAPRAFLAACSRHPSCSLRQRMHPLSGESSLSLRSDSGGSGGDFRRADPGRRWLYCAPCRNSCPI